MSQAGYIPSGFSESSQGEKSRGMKDRVQVQDELTVRRFVCVPRATVTLVERVCFST